MGRPKKPEAKPPVPKQRNERKEPSEKPKRQAMKTRPLPKNKNDMKSLAKYRTEYSQKTLANRLRSLSAENRASFAKYANISARQVQRMSPTNTRTAHPSKLVEGAVMLWKCLVSSELHQATMKKLQEEVESDYGALVPQRTLKNWTRGVLKPPAPQIIRESNDPALRLRGAPEAHHVTIHRDIIALSRVRPKVVNA